jgi:hypothetical protein
MSFLDVIDAISLAGSRHRPNEDSFGRAGKRVWVIDGATSLCDHPLVPGSSDAAWIAMRANEAFTRHAGMADTRRMLLAVADDLETAFIAERARAPQEPWEMPCAAFLMLTVRDRSDLEIASLGDCRCLIHTADHLTHAFGATPESDAREAAHASRHAAGQGSDARIRTPEVLAMLRANRAKVNTPGHLHVLAPDRSFVEGLRLEGVSLRAASHALLMTDGFAALNLRYRDFTDEAFVPAALDSGLARLAMRLRKIEDDIDPDCTRHPRWKRSDDASAVLVEIG